MVERARTFDVQGPSDGVGPRSSRGTRQDLTLCVGAQDKICPHVLKQGEGSGLGLTVARRIIRKFGGELRVESVEGRGTACSVTLSTNSPKALEGSLWTTAAAHSEPEPSHSS
ncbi:MAG: ATP-binding protein [Nitrospira sp. LK70]|nr:ATP-binding protein [Nitrospira sp. LK70]